MKYTTAVKRLHSIAERCQLVSDRATQTPLAGVYAFGVVLDTRADLDFVQAAFVLDLPPDELPWSVRPAAYGALASMLEIDKGGVGWYWRPAARRVSNHYILRPLRIWSRETGPDTAALEALRSGRAEELRLPPPTDAELQKQLAEELATSLTHLRRVRDGYWERDWRRDNRGGPGIFPENHLWDATDGYLDLLDATR